MAITVRWTDENVASLVGTAWCGKCGLRLVTEIRNGRISEGYSGFLGDVFWSRGDGKLPRLQAMFGPYWCEWMEKATPANEAAAAWLATFRKGS